VSEAVPPAENRSGEHLVFLDYFRGVAILAVFCDHSFWAMYTASHDQWNGIFFNLQNWRENGVFYPFSLGYAGVAIFFVVSGFCIHLSYERSQPKSFKLFFLRRFFRIYPPYFVALLLYLPLAYYQLKLAGGGTVEGVGQVVSHLLLVHNLFPAYIDKLDPSFWSIAVEAHLYLLYPVLLWLTLRLGWARALLITAALELLLRTSDALTICLHPDQDLPANPSGQPLYYWFSWAIGAVLADAYLKKRPLPFTSLPLWFWPALFLVCSCFKPLAPFGFLLAALATARCIAHLLQKGTASMPTQGWRDLAWNHLRWAGVVSYSAYLLHQIVLSLEHKILVKMIYHGTRPPLLIVFGAAALDWAVVFVISYLFYRYVESPSIAWGKAVIKRTKVPAIG